MLKQENVLFLNIRKRNFEKNLGDSKRNFANSQSLKEGSKESVELQTHFVPFLEKRPKIKLTLTDYNNFKLRNLPAGMKNE